MTAAYFNPIIAFFCYGIIIAGILVMYAVNSVHIERTQKREQWNKDYKENEESHRIGFLFRLRDERRELKNNGI